jgi:Raf kinase inhibitor-like YbhB/YbcL family protein
MELTSTAFGHEGAIPSAYTCQGGDRSPPLEWRGAPAGTRAFALLVDDPDAPDPAAPKVVWVHWVLANLPGACKGLPGGVAPTELPRGTVQGRNDWKRLGYGGPCPPVGRHRYFFRLFALDSALSVSEGVSRTELEHAMQGHVLATAVLMGTYEKSR